MAGTGQAPGVSSREVNRSAPTIRGGSKSVGAMVVSALAGPVNRAIKLDGFGKFLRIFAFAGIDPNGYGAESVRAFFDTAGNGSELWVVRAQATTSPANNVAAAVTLTDGTNNVLTATAVGPGVSYNSLRVATTREDENLGSFPANIPASASATYTLNASVCAAIEVGDQIRITDGTTTIRGLVTSKTLTTITYTATVTPGAIIAFATGAVYRETFTLSVLLDGQVVQGPYRGLRVSPTSVKNHFATRINVAEDDEALVTVAIGTPVYTASNDARPTANAAGTVLANGNQDTVYTDADYIGNGTTTGLNAYDKIKRIRMLAVPGVYGTNGAVAAAVVNYAANRSTIWGIPDLPVNTAVATAITNRQTQVPAQSFGSLYYPWPLAVSSITGQRRATPPSGRVMGVAAKNDRLRGIGKAPAGETDGLLPGCDGVERELTDTERNSLAAVNINLIEKAAGGVAVLGSRTLLGGEYEQVNKRRASIYVRTSLEDGLQWVKFENNEPETRSKVKRSVDAFLSREWKSKTFVGDTEDEAFRSQCDEFNNPSYVINANRLVVSVEVNYGNTIEQVEIPIALISSTETRV